MKFELNDEYVEEVFELLCEIPFETATLHDTEPPTRRYVGIEQLISQLAEATTEYCLCGCGEEIKDDKAMITDGFGWVLYDCADKIRNGNVSKAGYFSPDGIRILPPPTLNG